MSEPLHMDAETKRNIRSALERGFIAQKVQEIQLPELQLTEHQKSLSFIGDYWSSRTIVSVTYHLVSYPE